MDFPGARPTLLEEIGGLRETTQTAFAVSGARLGPIATSSARAVEETPPDESFGDDGILGNALLAACAAVVFDVPGRTLWLEPPCDRSIPENRADMQLGHSDVFTTQPWVVQGVLRGGSAERAGLRAGDRLLEVAGAPASEEAYWRIAALMAQPAGTRVRLVVDRNGEKKRIDMTLIDSGGASP